MALEYNAYLSVLVARAKMPRLFINKTRRRKKVVRKEESHRDTVWEEDDAGEIAAPAHDSSSTFSVIKTALALSFSLHVERELMLVLVSLMDFLELFSFL